MIAPLLSRGLAACFLLGSALPSIAAESPPRVLPVLMTESGTNYVDVEILQFDPEGPIFRHRDGMAKLPYHTIKEKTRTLLGYPMPVSSPTPPPAAIPAPEADGHELTLIPVRITTQWVVFQPQPAPICRRPLHPWFHHQAAWPFEDPFRPFAAVDLMVTGGVVPHPGWHGPQWIW